LSQGTVARGMAIHRENAIDTQQVITELAMHLRRLGLLHYTADWYALHFTALALSAHGALPLIVS